MCGNGNFGQVGHKCVVALNTKVGEVMKTYQFSVLFFYIFLVGFGLNIFGCGGSNLNNPVSDPDTVEEDITDSGDTVVALDTTQNIENVEEAGELDVTVTVTKKAVKPGEQVELTASVKGVRGTSVVLNWLNITEYGTLSATNDNPVTWTAPDTLGEVNTRVEVLQLVVTVISEIVSVESTGIQTDTQIFSDTTEILLKVTRE